VGRFKHKSTKSKQRLTTADKQIGGNKLENKEKINEEGHFFT
jgi:hypothetical protein